MPRTNTLAYNELVNYGRNKFYNIGPRLVNRVFKGQLTFNSLIRHNLNGGVLTRAISESGFAAVLLASAEKTHRNAKQRLLNY